MQKEQTVGLFVVLFMKPFTFTVAFVKCSEMFNKPVLFSSLGKKKNESYLKPLKTS